MNLSGGKTNICFGSVLSLWHSAQETKKLPDSAKLKKAAKHFGEKKVEMIHVKDLLKTTGYVRGGCSPIGMKKQFPTAIDETATLFDRIYVSAGQRGVMLGLNPLSLAEYTGAGFEDITV